MDDGSYRGAALNVAARLCGRAHGGEVIVSEATSRLAGRLGGLQYSDRGRVHLKNIPEPVHILQAYSELDAPPRNRWVLMFFGKPGRTLGWKLGLAVVLVAAADGRGRCLPDRRRSSDAAATPRRRHGTRTSGGLPWRRSRPRLLAADAGLDAIVPAALWKDCRLQTVPEPNGHSDSRVPPAEGDAGPVGDLLVPERLRLAVGLPGGARPPCGLSTNTGKCNAFVWGGELQWLHGAGQARRARLLLLRRQRRRHRLDAPASRPADAS